MTNAPNPQPSETAGRGAPLISMFLGLFGLRPMGGSSSGFWWFL
jgi:hypothetical protein